MENISEDDLLNQLNNAKIRDYAPAIAYSAIVVTLGIIGNVMSVSFYGFKVPRTTTNIIITALAIVDLITCIVISDEIVELCFTLTFTNVGGCKAMYFFNHTLSVCSGFMLLLVAFDRFRKVCRAFSWQLSTLDVKRLLFVIFFFAVALSVRDWIIIDVVPVAVVDHYTNKTINVFYCSHTKKEALQIVVKVSQLIDLIVLLGVVVTILLLYGLMLKRIWSLRKHLKRISNKERFSSKLHRNTPRNEDDYTVSRTDDSVGKRVDMALGDVTSESLEENHSNKSDGQERAKDIEDQKMKGNSVCIVNYDTDSGNISIRKEQQGANVANRSRRQTGVHPIERRVTIMMLTVTVISLLVFAPYFVVNLWTKQQGTSSVQEFNVWIQIALRSYMLNHAVNPYIIGFFNSRFRRFVRGLFCSRRL